MTGAVVRRELARALRTPGGDGAEGIRPGGFDEALAVFRRADAAAPALPKSRRRRPPVATAIAGLLAGIALTAAWSAAPTAPRPALGTAAGPGHHKQGHHRPDPPPSQTPTGDRSQSAVVPGDVFQLCQAVAAHGYSLHSKFVDSSARRDLVAAAGSEPAIAGYCARLFAAAALRHRPVGTDTSVGFG